MLFVNGAQYSNITESLSNKLRLIRYARNPIHLFINQVDFEIITDTKEPIRVITDTIKKVNNRFSEQILRNYHTNNWTYARNFRYQSYEKPQVSLVSTGIYERFVVGRPKRLSSDFNLCYSKFGSFLASFCSVNRHL